jgi:hypothetical protein
MGGKKAAKLVFLFSCMQLLLGQKKVMSLALCNMHMQSNYAKLYLASDTK